MSNNEAIRMKCNSAEFFDKYGHYRESKFTQLKHHWFWKINFIFRRLRVTKKFNGFVMLIEDDYYLLPDSLFMFNEMLKLTNDSNCIYSLGFRGLGKEISQTSISNDKIPFQSHIINK
ncbi:hypothetical protein B4U80_03197 [Leptotrombidium deliense]|uniref:Alpha-1,6-mannosyl-glycoprotein 2-beta-N-acetylglucosaminyltransferase n=1 Tax=Leptotrombidium deliense TaxID=299467 RepID=A0A443S0A0_9ACAR|nr:hypothetical protein B4U80_03197 [Leptotrombidium deliense]